MQLNIQTEVRRTRPDYVVYVPKSLDGSTGDTGNEHFLVFDGPDGSLMAVWTQSTHEGMPDQRIVFSRSDDGGHRWTGPRKIAGEHPQSGRGMASWGFPMISTSGRIYVVFSRHIGVNDIFTHTTGWMACIYSDDAGETWSDEQLIPFPRSKWDNPDPSVPPNWIVWQRPLRLSKGKYYAGFTRWISPRVRPPTPMKIWWAEASVVEFMRFENLDENPHPMDFEMSYFMTQDNALQVGLIGHPDVSVVQEPSLVRLPDSRLFCVVRTTTGHPYYTVSEDEGGTWCPPEPIRQHDNGPELLHPCSPCPIYRVGKDEYVLLYHNHDGHFQQYTPKDSHFHRRPIMIARGRFQPGAKQPVWFSAPRFLMDNDGIPLGYGNGRCDLAMYASMTKVQDEPVLWYPDRKFFLLGKCISLELLSEMEIRT